MFNPSEPKRLNQSSQPTPARCFTSSLVAGGLSFLLYRLTTSIAQTLAASPIQSHNPTAVNISSAVRTLVIGLSALATGIFGIVALGLLALGIQLLWQRSRSAEQPPQQ